LITLTEILRFLDKSYPAWVASTIYKPGQYLTQSGVIYEVVIEHTSGTFADDLAAGKLTVNSLALQCMNNAISEVNKYCKRDFRQASYTNYYNGRGTCDLFIKNMPLSDAAGSVSEIEYLDSANGWSNLIDGSGDTIDNSIVKYRNKIRLLKGYYFPLGDKNVKITAISGYASQVEWQTGTVYAVGNNISNNGNNYLCLTAHTAGTFATDLAAGKWILNTAEVMPGVIKQVTLEKAAWSFKLADGSGGGLLGLSSTNLGGQSSQGKGIDAAALVEKHNKILDKFVIQTL
jgi:hypothetical protein